MPISRLSERVGPTGSLQGEGLANVLGRPPFDPLTLALREAGQNIWDARKRSGSDGLVPRMLVRVRSLSLAQSDSLRSLLSAGDKRDEEPASTDILQRQLAESGRVPVLEICDFGTSGLEGEVDPQSAQGRFVRFFFDVGAAHFGDGDGGTYGYGRSSLYLASSVRTILVDSLVQGSENRRFMACRIGNSYEKKSIQGVTSRFTGRHFWGQREGERIAPLEHAEAKSLANSLGMPIRPAGAHGTSILIPWPKLPERDAGERIVQILLHNLWPKLVSKVGRNAMHIEVELDGQPIEIPDPNSHPHYSLFAGSLLSARTQSESHGAIPIVVQRTTVTGHIAFASSQRDHGAMTEQGSEIRPEDVFLQGVHHVALMRPSELVVRYLDFPGVGEGKDWAGVFVCSNDSEIRSSFAMSEPPAHDDWVPDRLEGTRATLVRMTKRRIPEAVNARFGVNPSTLSDGSAGLHSLAAAADLFGTQFLAGDGSAPGSTSGATGTGTGSRARLRPMEFVSLSAEEGFTVARFRTGLTGEEPVFARAIAEVDGLGQSEPPSNLLLPAVRRWISPDGSSHPGDTHCVEQPGDYHVEVEFRGKYAVIAKLELMEDPRDD